MIIKMTDALTWKGNFCSTCLINRPIRSKHCRHIFLLNLKSINYRICDKCVMRYDHHCPWLRNCIGVKNHRSFLIYLILLNLASGLVLSACLYCNYFKSLLNFIKI